MTAIVPEIEFITFDKSAMTRELLRLRTTLAARRFDCCSICSWHFARA